MGRVRHRQRATFGLVALVFALGLLAPEFAALTPVAQPALAQTSDVATPAVASPEASPVQPAGTPIPANAANQVMLSGPWRITVVSARRGAELPDIKLTAHSGRDWVVTIFDVTNWSKQSADFQARDFGIRTAGQTNGGGLATRTTEDVAAQLRLAPKDVNAKQTIAGGDTVRLAMVFQINDYERNPAFAFNGAAMPLAISFATSADPAALPSVSQAPTLKTAKVDKAPDGATIVAEGTTYTLAGLDAPVDKDCFATQSTSQLAKLAGKSVLIEPAPRGASGQIYAWVDNGKNAPTLINQAMISGGYAAATINDGAPFAASLTEADRTARYGLQGLWAACTAPHGVEIPQDGERNAIKIGVDGKATDYEIWVPWPSQIVALPDGGAWAFFSANAVLKNGAGDKLIYASHYDQHTGEWSLAKPLPGGKVQFGVSAVVDDAGHVHVVYSDRKADTPTDLSVLRYVTDDGKGGWTQPVAVAESKEAGHQLSPSLTIDRNGVLHVLWQDQREWSAADRQASVVNADIFSSQMDLNGDRTWSKAELISVHKPGEVGSRPHIVADGNRLVAVWSIYTTALGLDAAARVEWATRSVTDPKPTWSKPQTLIAGRGESFGGRLLDVQADPTGGVVLAYGRRNLDTFLFVRRLPAGSQTWGGDTLITFGKNGSFPSLAINEQGTVYIAYNLGEGAIVDAGITALAHNSITPGKETNLTEKEKEAQGRPVLTTDLTGSPWVLYFNQTTEGVANEVRVVRRVEVPVSGV
jgi:endonuclease YncB( thermonuclease family)